MSDVSGYIIAYKRTTDNDWNIIQASQPSIGNISVKTEFLLENTEYQFKIAGIKIGGQGSWSDIQTRTTSTNTIAYPIPTVVTATGIINGILLDWHDIWDDGLYRAMYNVYHNTSSDPSSAVKIASTLNPWYIWQISDSETDFVPQYFWVTTVSPSGLESSFSDIAYDTPLQLTSIDYKIEMKPWTSNIKIWEDATVFGKFYWADPTETLDATITYSDGTSLTITKNLTGTSFSNGTVVYIYKNEDSGILVNTTTFGNAVGEGKNLLAIIDVSTSSPSTIQPYNSYTPTIGAGGIAAKTITSQHLITDNAVITNSLQLQNGIITSDHIINISASKILLNGTTYLSSWADPTDLTKIDGSKIYTGTIYGTAIDPDNKIPSDRILNIEASQVKISGTTYFNSLIATGTTKIDGGAIHTETLTVGYTNLDSTVTTPITDAQSTAEGAALTAGTAYGVAISAQGIIDVWGANGNTTINGSVITSGTITGTVFSCINSGYVSFAGGKGILNSTGITLTDTALRFFSGASELGDISVNIDGGGIRSFIMAGMAANLQLQGQYVYISGNTTSINSTLYSQSVIAGADKTYDLGGSSRYWANSYIMQGYFGHLSCGGSTTVSLTTGGVTDVYINSVGVLATSSSSIRYKENIRDVTDFSWIYDIRPIMYNWKPDYSDNKDDWLGFIAEEVNVLCPELTWYNDKGQVEGVHYKNFVVPLVGAIQQLKKRIDELEYELNNKI